MKSSSILKSVSGLACLVLGVAQVMAGSVVSGGTATITLTEGNAASLGWLDAHFNDKVTRGGCLANPAPGNAYFNRLSGVSGTLGTGTSVGLPGTPGVVHVIDPIRPYGRIPVPPLPDTFPGVPGQSRSRQLTTLEIEPSNILGTWSPSNDSYAFVGNSTLGEQIALTSIQRWGGPFTGVLVYGDFAIRYVPGRAGVVTGGRVLSGLVLTSNIDFLNAAWADIGNATITSDGRTLSISGDLLTSGGLFVLDPTAVPGTMFGTISITAKLRLIPIPAGDPVNDDPKAQEGVKDEPKSAIPTPLH